MVIYYLFLFKIKLKNLFIFVLILVRRSNEPGWLEGTLNGKSGLIPENYVEILN